MKTVDVLTKAKAIIANPADWVQEVYFRKLDDGRNCYCSLGAIAKAMSHEESNDHIWWSESTDSPAARLLAQVVKAKDGTTFAPYNDSHTHAEVMEAFDKAIALAQAA